MFSVGGSGHSFLTLPQTGWVKFYGMAMIQRFKAKSQVARSCSVWA